MIIKFNFIDDRFDSISCTMSDDKEIQDFDKRFPFKHGDENTIVVNGELRISYSLPDEDTIIIFAKKDQIRRLHFEGTYNALSSQQIGDIRDHLIELKVIAAKDDTSEMFTSMQPILAKLERLQKVLNEIETKLNTNKLQRFNQKAALTFLRDVEELGFALEQVGFDLSAIDLKNDQSIAKITETNKIQLIDGLTQFHVKLNSQYKKLLADLPNLQQLILGYIYNTQSFSKASNKLNFILENLQSLNDRKLLTELMLDEATESKRYILNMDALKRIGLGQFKRAMLMTKTKCAELDANENAIIELTDARANSKKFYKVPANMLSTQQLIKLFLDQQAILDFSNSLRGHGALGGEFFNDLHCYDVGVQKDYEVIHSQLDQELKEILTKIPSKEPIEIVFIGCGKGEEMESTIKLLEQTHKNFKIYGFDISEENIAAAKKQSFIRNRPVYLKQGDANQIETLIQDFRNEHNHGKAAPHSITVASGFLTRLVNKGQHEAYKIFKKIARDINTIIISGRTSNLIRREDAKAAGFAIKQRSYSSNGELRTLDRYDKLPIEQYVENLFAKKHSETSITIAIKDHPQSMQVLRYMFEKKYDALRGAVIDLREVVIKQEEALFYLDMIAKHLRNQHCRIMVTGNEPWLTELIKNEPALKGNIIRKGNNTTVTLTDPKSDMWNPVMVYEQPKVSEKLHGRAEEALHAIEENVPFSFRR